MDDTQNEGQNQTSIRGSLSDIPQPLEPEEVAADVDTPDAIKQTTQLVDVPVYEESKSKLYIIGGIVAFFILITGGLLWFFLARGETKTPTIPTVVKKDPVTLTYWGLWDEKEVLDPVFEEYKKANPHVTIQYEKMAAGEQYRQRLIARSKTGNGPDIFRFHNTWIPEMTEVLTEIPEQVYPAKEYEKTFYPIVLKDMKIGSKYYGIPFMVDGMMLFYNESMLRQAGIVAPPGVWIGDQNDVYSVANALTVRDSQGSIVTSGIAMGTTSNIDHFSSLYGLLLLVNGGDLKKLDQPEAAEALQFYRKFAEDNIWSDALPYSTTAFIQGKVAMIIAPSWTLIEIKAKNPNLSVKTASIPKGLNNTSVSLATYWAEGVSRYSKNQLEAWKLLVFMSEKKQLERIYQEQSKTRPIGWISSRKDMAQAMKGNDYLAPLVKHAEADEFVSLPLADRTYDAGLNDELNQYIRNAINETAKGVDYGSALRTAHNGVLQLLSRYKIN